jgi:hypothetical protein
MANWPARISLDEFGRSRDPLRIQVGFGNAIENQFDQLLA